MQNYKTLVGVIRMKSAGCSNRECRNKFGIGLGTIQRTMKIWAESGIPLSDLERLHPEKLIAMFYPPEKARRKKAPLPNWESICERLMEKGSKTNLFFRWEEYKLENPQGYQYTQFVEHFHRYADERYGKGNLSMAVERAPGERVYIDWAGDKPRLVLDHKTGEMLEIHLFVTAVGISGLPYAEAFQNEQMPNFVAGTVHALESYGALPRYLVPDNAATAVTKHTKDEILISSAYQDLESFYDVVVLPPPPYKPKGKPTVEKAVQTAETWILEKLKEKAPFPSFGAVNEEIALIIADLRSKKPRGWEFTKQEAFDRYDKPSMRPLGSERFSPVAYVAFSKVPDNYHLQFDGHHYSVLYTYLGKPVILKASAFKVSICDEYNALICEHERSYREFPKYITKDEHMPPHHLYYKELNSRDGAYYRRWASSFGPSMSTLIESILKGARHEEQAYGSCNGVLHLCDGKPRHICESAAKKCVELRSCKYSYFKTVLSNMINRGEAGPDSLPEHENLWGEGFYK